MSQRLPLSQQEPWCLVGTRVSSYLADFHLPVVVWKFEIRVAIVTDQSGPLTRISLKLKMGLSRNSKGTHHVFARSHAKFEDGNCHRRSHRSCPIRSCRRVISKSGSSRAELGPSNDNWQQARSGLLRARQWPLRSLCGDLEYCRRQR